MIEATLPARLANAMGLAPQAHGMTRMVTALYEADGAILSVDELMDATASCSDDDRYPEIIKVWVCRMRKRLGFDAIETVRFAGYRMSQTGLVKLKEYLK